PQDVVKAGDIVLVRILDLDPERERVSLSMRRVPKEKQIAWMSDDFETEADTIPEQEDKEDSSE
ncbi:MAG: hypothetical protein KAI94_13590, partial [Anaerolineales bacterium]|nr:hypothetical protein [Anaerolineales bacterium]